MPALDAKFNRLCASQSIPLPVSEYYSKPTSFCSVQAIFLTYKYIFFQRLWASIHKAPNLLALECIRPLFNVLKLLLNWLPTILRVLVVLGNNLHRVMFPIAHLQTFWPPRTFFAFPASITTFKSSKSPFVHSFSYSMFIINFHENTITFGIYYTYMFKKELSNLSSEYWNNGIVIILRHLLANRTYVVIDPIVLN